MKNYLKPDVMQCDIKINDDIMKKLIATGRLQWHQQADGLAISQALTKLLADMAEGKAEGWEVRDRALY